MANVAIPSRYDTRSPFGLGLNFEIENPFHKADGHQYKCASRPRSPIHYTGVSKESIHILTFIENAYGAYSDLVSYHSPLEIYFTQLSGKWKNETQFSSSPTEVANNPSYKEIIKLGPAAIPFILQELEKEPALWFDALTCITGEQPIPDEHAGDIDAMAEDWISWGVEHGYTT